MPSSYPPELRRQVVELARAGTRVAVLAETFGVSAVSTYNWLKQDRIDRGEETGQTTDQQLELAAVKRRIAQLETELAVARKVNEFFLSVTTTCHSSRRSGAASDKARNREQDDAPAVDRPRHPRYRARHHHRRLIRSEAVPAHHLDRHNRSSIAPDRHRRGRLRELPSPDLQQLPDLGPRFNEGVAWRHEIAELGRGPMDSTSCRRPLLRSWSPRHLLPVIAFAA